MFLCFELSIFNPIPKLIYVNNQLNMKQINDLSSW